MGRSIELSVVDSEHSVNDTIKDRKADDHRRSERVSPESVTGYRPEYAILLVVMLFVKTVRGVLVCEST